MISSLNSPQKPQDDSRDISDHMVSELVLRQSEDQSRAILAAIPDMMFRVGADGVYRGFMTPNREIDIVARDYNPVGKWMHDFLPADLAQRQQLALERALRTGELQVYEQQVQMEDRLQYEEVRVIKSGDDEVLFMVRDISDRKQTELALQELNQSLEARVKERTAKLQASENHNKAIVEAIPDLLLRVKPDGTCIEFIPSTLPTDQSIPIETNISEVLPPNLLQQQLDAIAKAITTRELQVYEHEFFHGDRMVYEEIRIIAINTEEALLIVRDVSQRKLAEFELKATNEQLAISNQELARANRLKDEFLSTISHELRTPLNAIIGMTDLLKEEVFGEINTEQLDALQIIERSSSNLLELIVNILDFTNIAAGRLILNLRPTNINHLCESALELVQKLTETKKIQIESQIPENLPNLNIDHGRIQQVLAHLISNAIKFSPEQSLVKLDVSILSDRDANRNDANNANNSNKYRNWLRFTVTDQGIGIAPEDLPRLFQPFSQVDGTLNRQYEGMGIGLAIVKQIVELHDGRVIVESNLGIGSIFSIELPIKFEH
jgi:signal transduction histidine kinase